MHKDFKGLHVPHHFISLLGVELACNLSAYHQNIHKLTDEEVNQLVKNNIGKYEKENDPSSFILIKEEQDFLDSFYLEENTNV